MGSKDAMLASLCQLEIGRMEACGTRLPVCQADRSEDETLKHCIDFMPGHASEDKTRANSG